MAKKKAKSTLDQVKAAAVVGTAVAKAAGNAHVDRPVGQPLGPTAPPKPGRVKWAAAKDAPVGPAAVAEAAEVHVVTPHKPKSEPGRAKRAAARRPAKDATKPTLKAKAATGPPPAKKPASRGSAAATLTRGVGPAPTAAEAKATRKGTWLPAVGSAPLSSSPAA